MYTVLVDEERCKLNSRALMRALREAGIESRPLWRPLHRSELHDGAHRLPETPEALVAT